MKKSDQLRRGRSRLTDRSHGGEEDECSAKGNAYDSQPRLSSPQEGRGLQKRLISKSRKKYSTAWERGIIEINKINEKTRKFLRIGGENRAV